ncbi:hypothetical protein QTP88_021427 [Uroleucon formosanum]
MDTGGWSTVHSPKSWDDHDGHGNTVNNNTNHSKRYARSNCARCRTFGPIYTTTHEDSGGGARDCRCRYGPSWDGSKSQFRSQYRTTESIDDRCRGSRTDVVGYGRLNRRSNSTTDALRCGAVRCGAVQQTRGPKWQDSCAVCTTVYSVYGDSVI